MIVLLYITVYDTSRLIVVKRYPLTVTVIFLASTPVRLHTVILSSVDKDMDLNNFKEDDVP